MLNALQAKRVAETVAAGTCDVVQWPITDGDIRTYGWSDQQVSNLWGEDDIAVVLATAGAPPACIDHEELETLDAALTAQTHALRQRMANTYDEREFYALWQKLWKIDDVQRSTTRRDPDRNGRDIRCPADSSAPADDGRHLSGVRVLRPLAAVGEQR
jgi:hypothetical protein